MNVLRKIKHFDAVSKENELLKSEINRLKKELKLNRVLCQKSIERVSSYFKTVLNKRSKKTNRI